MAKTIDLSRVNDREKLKPRPNSEPYWQRLRPGAFVGFVPAVDGSAGAWSARSIVGGKPRQQKLGSFGKGVEAFAKAKTAAEAWIAGAEDGASARGLVLTVADACRAYAKAKPQNERFFARTIYPDPIAEVRLEKLKKADLAAWRERLEATTPLRKKSDTGVLSASSINREMTPVRAALYAAGLVAGNPKTEAGWQVALKKNGKALVRRPRKLYLDKSQRKELLEMVTAIEPAAAPFVRALGLLGLPVRPGALAQLTVANFSKELRQLHIPAMLDKAHPARDVPLSPTQVAFLAEQAKSKLPKALLFTQADGVTGWTAETWKRPIRAAADAAGLSEETCAYTLRHCTLTDLIVGGMDVFTAAEIGGTSIEEIEETYGKVRADVARELMEKLAV